MRVTGLGDWSNGPGRKAYWQQIVGLEPGGKLDNNCLSTGIEDKRAATLSSPVSRCHCPSRMPTSVTSPSIRWAPAYGLIGQGILKNASIVGGPSR